MNYEQTSFGLRIGHMSSSCSLAIHWTAKRLCQRGSTLFLPEKCMMARQTIIDYIVVHKLCHFHQRDHTDAFWNEVDKVMPDFW